MLTLPDTLWVLLTLFASMAWSTTLQSIVLGIPDLAIQVKFLEPSDYYTVINFAFIFIQKLFLVVSTLAQFKLVKQIPELDYIVCSSVAFKSHAEWNSAQHVNTLTNMILQQIPLMAWTTLVMWYTCCN